MATPVIIEAALNGGTTKRKNPHVPRSVDEIVESGLACLEAGAAIVHNHNDEPVVFQSPIHGASSERPAAPLETADPASSGRDDHSAHGGSPRSRPTGRHAAEPYAAAWRRIYARHPNALLYTTMAGGGPHTTIEERYRHIEELDDAGLLRIGLVDPGSVNLGGLDAEGVPAVTEAVYQNTYADVRYMIDCCRARRLAPSISIFEPGFLRLALGYHAAGKLPRGALVKLYFGGGTPGFGLPPTRASLDAYLAMLDGTGLPWSVAVLGGDVTRGLAQLALERGGHARVGLEDYDGPRQPRNEELVAEVVALAEAAGRPVATPAEAAEVLGLPKRAPV